MPWARDEAKLGRVRALMAEQELDALVVRAPDNVLYLKPGDVIEAEIERIGVLRNPVVSWHEGHGEPPPPRIRPWGEA